MCCARDARWAPLCFGPRGLARLGRLPSLSSESLPTVTQSGAWFGEIAVAMQSPVSVYETLVVVLSHSQPGPDVLGLMYRSHCMAAHVTSYRHPSP